MNIGIVSLDDSDLINVGGKHIHQKLLKKGLESKGHKVFNFFPKKTLYFYTIRIFFAVLNKFGFAKAYCYKWTLETHRKFLSNLITDNDIRLDIAYAQDPVAAVAISKANTDCKIVMTLHGYLAKESVNYGNYNEKESRKVIEYGLVYEEEALKVASSIITVDTSIQNYIISEFNYSGNIRILKNAINPEIFNNTPENKIVEVKNRLSIGNEKFVILIPRRLVRKNGVDIALRAMNELGKEVSSFHMLIMGDGPEMANLKNLCDSLDLNKYISFLGSVNYDDVSLYYDLSDIVVIPSVIRDGVEEATSLSMLEGMAAKKTVVVSNIGGMKEVIRNENNGFSFEQENFIQLAKILLSIKNSSRETLIEISERAYIDVCNLHHYIRHTEEYLKEA